MQGLSPEEWEDLKRAQIEYNLRHCRSSGIIDESEYKVYKGILPDCLSGKLTSTEAPNSRYYDVH